MPKKLRNAFIELRHLPKAVRLAWEAAPGWAVFWVALLVVSALLPAAVVTLTKLLVSRLEAAPSTESVTWSAAEPVLTALAALAVVVIALELSRSLTTYVRTVQAEFLKDHISRLIHEQSVRVDLGFYERPEFFDHLHRARAEAGSRPVALLESVGSMFQNGLTLLAMAALLIPYGIWLPPLLLASAVPALYVLLHSYRAKHRWREKVTADERRGIYFDWVLTSRNTAAEVRLFDLGGHFQRLFQGVRHDLRDGEQKLAMKHVLAELVAILLSLGLTGALMAWMLWRFLQDEIKPNDLAVFFLVFQQGQRTTQALLQNLGAIYYNSLFLGNLFAYLGIEPEIVKSNHSAPVPLALREGYRIEHVSFHYPGSGRLALNDFSLEIPAGSIIALVGNNGAGKTTLIKLLCRFYDPTAGQITLDGVDLRDFSPDELRQRITVLFQEPVHYNSTATENIALGSLAAQPESWEIEEAARAAGADMCIQRLPKKYDQLLGNWFLNGAELSTGEWQRVALARAALRQAPVLILDEPTSAMDPWAEADWVSRLRTLAKGRTVLLITHRLTTARCADEIHVMMDGSILESGSHRDLIAKGGRYSELWAGRFTYHQFGAV